MYRYFFYFLFVLLVVGCSAEDNSSGSLTLNKAESENNQEVENQPTDESGDKTANNESSLAELEADFSLVPLTEDDLQETKDTLGEGCLFFVEDNIYAIGYGTLLVAIGGEPIWLDPDVRSEWRGQPIKLEIIRKGPLSGGDDYQAIVDLVVTRGNNVSTVEVFQRCEVWNEEKNNY